MPRAWRLIPKATQRDAHTQVSSHLHQEGLEFMKSWRLKIPISLLRSQPDTIHNLSLSSQEDLAFCL